MFKNTINWLKKKWWIPTLIVLGILILWSSLQDETFVAKVVTAQKGTIKQYLIEDGKTRLNREYTLSMPVNGKIKRIALMEGDIVSQGQVLVSLDNYFRRQEYQSLQSRLQEVNAQTRSIDISKPKSEDYASARARIQETQYLLQQIRHQREMQEIELEEQRKELKRQTTLYHEGVIDLATFEKIEKSVRLIEKQLAQALAQEKSSALTLKQTELALEKLSASHHDNEYQRQVFKAQKSQIYAQLNIKKDELNQAVLTSPVHGPILAIQTKDAGPIAAGTPLLKVGDLSSIRIETDVLSEEVHQLKKGQPVEISGKSLNNKTLMGKVSLVFPMGFTKLSALGVEQQRVKVLIAFDNSDVKLRPGTSVDLKLITAQKKNTVIIPERSLFKQDGKWQVFKLDASDKAFLQEVSVGLKNDDEAEIIKGLKANDRIVEERDNKLKEGLKIIINGD